MSVSNGQLANQTTFNNAFVSRTAASTSTVSILALNNGTLASGASISNAQQAINETFDAVGMTGIGDATRKNYSSNNIVANGDSRKVAIGKLDAEFDSATGHTHTGSAGDAPQISAANLADWNDYWTEYQLISLTGASGTSTVVTTEMSGKSPGGDSVTAGVITTGNNKVVIKDSSTETFIEDAGGQRVYGRVTESAGVWTVTYYTNEAGVETAHSLASSNIEIYFKEVFTSANRPTTPSSPSEFGTLDVTADVVDASASQRGLVSTGTQSFGGDKTFQGSVEIQSEAYVGIENNNQSGSGVTLTLPTKMTVRLINGSLTSIGSITAPAVAQLFFLRNVTGAAVTITNSDSGATSVLTGTAADFTLEDDATCILLYDLTSARWTMIGGGGSGGALGFGEVPSGTVNGVNDTFGPLTYFPNDDDSILVFVDGVQRPKSEYTVTGVVTKSIEFGGSHIPVTDQTVYVWYLKQGSAVVPPAPSGAWTVEYRTLTSGESSSESLVLGGTPASPSGTLLDIIGGGAQVYSVDYSVSGANLSWSGLGLSGVLTTGDVLRIVYIT